MPHWIAQSDVISALFCQQNPVRRATKMHDNAAESVSLATSPLLSVWFKLTVGYRADEETCRKYISYARDSVLCARVIYCLVPT